VVACPSFAHCLVVSEWFHGAVPESAIDMSMFCSPCQKHVIDSPVEPYLVLTPLVFQLLNIFEKEIRRRKSRVVGMLIVISSGKGLVA